MIQYVIYGLPGMYQNWLSAALDPDSVFEQQGRNFLAHQSQVPWVIKAEVIANHMPDAHVINMYVGKNNLVWYLHNYFEKTDDIGIRTNYLAEDLSLLGTNTRAYGQLLDHWRSSYNIQYNTNTDYYTNSLVEYFYYWLIKKHDWGHCLSWIHPGSQAINLEYSNFDDLDKLSSCLQRVISNGAWFDQMYVLLRSANYQYINQGAKFLSKMVLIKDIDQFTILEQSYIGSLLHELIQPGKIVLDWFNPELRNRLWDRHREDLVASHRTNVLQYVQL